MGRSILINKALSGVPRPVKNAADQNGKGIMISKLTEADFFNGLVFGPITTRIPMAVRKGTIKKGLQKPLYKSCGLLVGLLSSRQFELPTTAGFDLSNRNN